jgi:hypothetical protein
MYNAVIIGSGKKGALNNQDLENGLLTYGAACFYNKSINLVGIIDKDIKKSILSSKLWETKNYNSIHEISNKIDIFIITTPPETHFKIFTEIYESRFRPKLIITEPVLSDEKMNCETLLQSFSDVGMLANYKYRNNKKLNVLKDGIYDKQFGKILLTKIIYNACWNKYDDLFEAIDFCNWYFGKCKDGKICGGIFKNELSTTFDIFPIMLKYEKCDRVLLHPIDNRRFRTFEIEIYTEHGKIILSDWCKKFEYYELKNNDKYNVYNPVPIKDDKISFDNNIPSLLKNAVGYLDGCNDLCYNSHNILDVYDILERIDK